MAGRKGGLGKGLDSLIPSKNLKSVQKELEVSVSGGSNESANKKANEEEIQKQGQFKISIEKIEPNRNQPRKTFNEDSLIELSESIRKHGVLSPLLVKKCDDYYEIIAGERRWRAAKKAGRRRKPVFRNFL